MNLKLKANQVNITYLFVGLGKDSTDAPTAHQFTETQKYRRKHGQYIVNKGTRYDCNVCLVFSGKYSITDITDLKGIENNPALLGIALDGCEYIIGKNN